ncbi:MAG: type II toxin-antitoxin system RelE/ParE family toxin [Rhizomicrobium sp.]
MKAQLLSPRARTDLDEIWEYTADKWNAEQADNYIREIWKTIELIGDRPGIGRSCDEIRQGYFKFPVGSHVMFYKKAQMHITVVRIVHRRMDFDSHL